MMRMTILLAGVWMLGLPLALLADLQNWEKGIQEAIETEQFDLAQRLAQKALADPATTAMAHEWLGHIALAQRRNEEAISHFKRASTEGRFSPSLEKTWASALINLGRHQEACALLETVLSRNPSQPDLRYRLANSYLRLGQPQKAWLHLEEVYRQGLRHLGITLQLARTRFEVGRDDLAAQLLDAVVKDNSSPNVLLEVGKMFFDNLLYRQSLDPLEKAWRASPGSYDLGMYLALTHYLLEQFDQSERILTAIRVGGTPSIEFCNLLGAVYARLGRWDEAQRELELAIQLAPDRADGYLNLALFRLERGDHQRAMALLEKGSGMLRPGTKILYTMRTRDNCSDLKPPQVIKEKDIVRGEFYSNLGNALQKMQHWVSATEVYLLALQVDNRAAAAYGGIGLVCQELGSAEAGMSFLRRGLELHPDAPDLHYYLGAIHSSMGVNDEAIANYRKAIRLQEPGVPSRYLLRLGIALTQATGGDSEAENLFLRALQRDPDWAPAHYELGKLYLKSKKFDRAEQSLEKAIRLDPMLPETYYQYGLACIRQGKREKGKSLLETFSRKRALRDSNRQAVPVTSASPSQLMP
jgi:tetratricopeptide (TPR) repeat protein